MTSVTTRSVNSVVDSVATHTSLLQKIPCLPNSPSSPYIDLEGVNLGRNGYLSIILLYVLLHNASYLIDVHLLPVFDIPNDLNALFSLYRVSVDGVKDLWLMELATRQGSRNLVAGLAICIRRDSKMSPEMKTEWQRTRDIGVRLFNPQYGGDYTIFNERSFRHEILQYCAQDVSLLPMLFRALWHSEVHHATRDRIKLSKSINYHGQLRSKIYGTWDEWRLEEIKEQWEDDIMFNAQHGEDFDMDCFDY
ncbi:hypothetical protein K431DRAFT_329098 [Polychaeton citri CBS 116435]|uniref:3'-5' exonuclease domain-containing protein n=1 Tax=Polychaeton citri CBS 116435 TaxID=1314669 RepID=A0A9P4QE32_9PEZI|nr:hypothetical protein K431DRAFT_329098 [Polychaeton citri CBS 116435]